MKRSDTFTFRLNQKERKLIAILAKKLQRSQSDAVRFVVINAAKEFEAKDHKNNFCMSEQ